MMNICLVTWPITNSSGLQIQLSSASEGNVRLKVQFFHTNTKILNWLYLKVYV